MATTPLPSKTGPCSTFRPAPGSRFCGVCGHTGGRHPLPTAVPKEAK